MPLNQPALKAKFKTALEEGRALGADGTDDAIADKLASAVVEWLSGYQPTVVNSLIAPPGTAGGPVTGTLTVTM